MTPQQIALASVGRALLQAVFLAVSLGVLSTLLAVAFTLWASRKR